MAARKSQKAKAKKAKAKKATKQRVPSLPGVRLDLNQLKNIYPKLGCQVEIVIMSDGDGGRPGGPRKTLSFHVPPLIKRK